MYVDIPVTCVYIHIYIYIFMCVCVSKYNIFRFHSGSIRFCWIAKVVVKPMIVNMCPHVLSILTIVSNKCLFFLEPASAILFASWAKQVSMLQASQHATRVPVSLTSLACDGIAFMMLPSCCSWQALADKSSLWKQCLSWCCQATWASQT